MTAEGTAGQREAMQQIYADRSESRWAFHYTDDPLIRYLRDRRLHAAMRAIAARGLLDPAKQSALVVCGGVGGEGTFLKNHGFRRVVVTDISDRALDLCRSFDPRLETLAGDAENLVGVPDAEFDLVIVQDGLHHLPRPALGLTEMLRVARTAAVVIEPYEGLVGRRLGTEWEVHGDAVNYVHRWTRRSFEQTARSYLLSRDAPVDVIRMWDHNVVINRLVERLPSRLRLSAAQAVYGVLAAGNRWGNMMVGIAYKPDGPTPARLIGH